MSADRINGVLGSVAIKAPCRVATTANITLSGTQTIDGVAVVADDRVLVKDQTTQTENGIWICDSSAWSRSKDFDGTRDVVQGTLVPVYAGTLGAGSIWTVTTANDVLPGTSSLTFTQSSISPTVFVQTLLDDTTAAAFLTTLGFSAFAQTLIDDSTAGATLTTLGVSAFAQTILDDADAATVRTTIGAQPVDATLTAFAALTIAANSLTIGTGADAFSQTTFAANTFPARASTGDLVAKTITDFALTVLDDTTAAAALGTLGLTATAAEINGLDVSAKVEYRDDFVTTSTMNSFSGTDPQVVAGLPASTSGLNGVFQITTGDDAAASMAVNGAQGHQFLAWRADSDGLFAEFRVKLSAITSVALFVGLSDQVSALEMPFTLGGGDALTSNATDAVGVLFDTGADTDNWWLVGVANNVDATKQDSAVAPVAGTYETWRIELSAAGAATFYRNGSVIGSAMTGAVTPTVLLTPYIAAFSRAAASRVIDLDYVHIQANRV